MVFYSWDKFCRPKKDGGFNIKECLSWNKALFCKWIYKVSRYRGIWAAWAVIYNLNADSIWEAIALKSDSWSWKNLLTIKDDLLKKLGSVALASETISSWVVNGKFNVGMAYNFFRDQVPQAVWAKVVWGPHIAPKHSVIATFAIKQALPTWDNIQKRSLQGPSCCTLCHSAPESIPHLFFSCPFSQKVLGAIKHWIGLDSDSFNLRQLLWLLRRHFRKRNWQCKFSKSAILATIYHIWAERNLRLFASKVKNENTVIREIKYVVSARLIFCQDPLPMEDRMRFLLD